MSESLAYVGDTGGADNRTPRQRHLARLRALEREAQDWIVDWEEEGDYFLPGAVRRRAGDRRKGAATGAAVNSVGILACRTQTAGIMSGLTSPARIWYQLGVPDLALMRWGPVKTWLHLVAEAMFRVFARSNLYQVLPSIYAALGAFGTACMIEEEDAQDLVRFYPWTTGTYFLAASARLTIDTGYRRLQLTVSQLIEKFGIDNVSPRVRRLAEQRQWDQIVEVVRVIEPNRDRQHGKLDASGMPVTSAWFEYNGDKSDAMLQVKGFRENPIMAPRWDAVGEDAYGRGPGWHALADCRMLQQYERRGGEITDALTEPPLASSAQLDGAYPLPGEVVKVGMAGAQSALQAIYQPHPTAVTVVDAKIQRLENRVNALWYADLWLSLTRDEGGQPITAREVAERHEEKLLQLGPALVRTYNELLDPTIERTFAMMVRASMPYWAQGETGPYFPPPPEELHGLPLRVEYISPLAIAQKLVGIAADERLAGFVGNVYAVKPDIVDKLDWDRMVEGYAERTSANPDIIVPQDKVDQVRADRAKQQQQQQQLAQLPDAAKSAQVLSQTDINGDSALNRLLYTQAGGAGVPAALPGAGRGG
jgi:hypothetical protein